MYGTVLVPLDGSKLVEDVVLTYVQELAGRLNLDVTLLHVCPPSESEMLPIYQAYVERVADLMKLKSRQIRKKYRGEKDARPQQWKAAVAVGEPTEEVLRYSNGNDVSLVVIAAHGKSGSGRSPVGTVADGVLRESKVPVWLVRPGVPKAVVYDEWPNRSVLVPLDGSALAEQALPHAEVIARQRGAEVIEVILFRVSEPPDILSTAPYLQTPKGRTPVPLQWDRFVEQEMKRIRTGDRDYLEKVADGLKRAGIKVRTEAEDGEPAEKILDYVNEQHVNLIVMTTHGRSGASRWAYGSVAQRILYDGFTPVLLVRPS